MFNVDLKRQAYMQLAYVLRQALHVVWINLLVGSSFNTLNGIRDYRNSDLYLLQFSASRIYLEHFLNDKFDPVNRDIYIENLEFINPKYRYNEIEDRENYVFNKAEGAVPNYLYNKLEIDNQPGFIVYVPMTIMLDTVMRLRIRQAVDIFNICTINYEIQNYE